jgi:antitoxin YefM
MSLFRGQLEGRLRHEASSSPLGRVSFGKPGTCLAEGRRLMYALYRLRAEDLDESFLETLKSQFADREIEIAVCETAEIEEDETSYLLRSPANRDRLLQAIARAERGEDLVTLDLGDLQ